MRRRQQMSLGLREHSAQLARQSRVEAIAVPATSQWLRSSKNLDFWSLALCSCILTLLCHSFTNAPQLNTRSSDSAIQTSTPATGAASNVPFKPFTLTSSKPEVKQED